MYFYFPSNELMNLPVSLTCGHTACKECIKKMMEEQRNRDNQQPSRHICFNCQTAFAAVQLKKNIVLYKLIGKIKIRCTNNGCSWKGQQEDMEKHFKECEWCKITCPAGCRLRLFRHSLDTHLETCKYQKVPCSYCGVHVRRFAFGEHESNCTDKPSPCPLGCAEYLPRSHVQLHLYCCRKRVVKCPVKGCQNFYRREDKEAHFGAYQDSHQELLISEVERLQCEIYNGTGGVKIKRVIRSVQCFGWRVKGSELKTKAKLSSPLFGFDRSQFLCLWSRDKKLLSVGKVTGSSPITMKARFVGMRDDDVLIFHKQFEATLKEGEKAGVKVPVGEFNDANEITIKLVLQVYTHIAQ
ncbi:TNF receptor-associated factor 5-like isoform X1 [Oculina patagonica]